MVKTGNFLILKKCSGNKMPVHFLGVAGMAHILLVKVQSRVVTAKRSEPQAFNSNVKGGGSGVAKLLSLRTET